jgi:hypothetical protein
MMQTLKGLLESKPFVVGLITAIAAAVGMFGYHVDVTTMLIVITPIEVAIGATGWGENAMKHQVEGQMKMHAMTLNASLQRPTFSDSGAPAKTPQAGFARLHTMIIIAAIMIAGACSLQVSCSSAQKIEQNGATCAGQQFSFDLIAQVAADLFTKNYTALEALAAQKGMAFVNCVVQSTITAQPKLAGAGSGSAVKVELNPIVANGNEWLSTHGASK